MALRFLSPLHKASRQIGIHLESACTSLGVSTTEGHILTYLARYAPCPIHELRRVFGLKRSTLTSLLDRLESRGFVHRTLHPNDRRSFLVALTDPGRSVADRLQVHLVELEARIDTAVTRGELAGFEAVLRAIGEVTDVEVRKPPPAPERAVKEIAETTRGGLRP